MRCRFLNREFSSEFGDCEHDSRVARRMPEAVPCRFQLQALLLGKVYTKRGAFMS